MPLVIADRVRETSTTTGTGTLTLDGAVTGFRTFGSAIGSGNTCYYTITLGADWEVGLGTVGTGTLARTTVLKSSNSNSAVNFGAGTKDVFVTYTAERSVYKDASGNVNALGTISSGVWNGTEITVPYGGTGVATLTGIVKGNGQSAFSAATAGTDYVAPGTATTFTATQTFNGSSSTLAMVLADAAETTTISATAATGTIAYDVTTQSVLYYTSNASANWTVNFRGSSGTSLNTLMSTGQSVTVTFLVTQGSTAYFNNAVQVDGSSVTPKYQGGTAWSAGNASSIDAYTYTIVKTGNAAFTVFAAQTRFA
jgi:hypothetical protein